MVHTSSGQVESPLISMIGLDNDPNDHLTSKTVPEARETTATSVSDRSCIGCKGWLGERNNVASFISTTRHGN